MGDLLDLLLGFTYIHIGIVGTLIIVLACVVSLIVWLARGKVLHALPSIAIVAVVPASMLGIIPMPDGLLAPLALGAAIVALYLHVRHLGDGKLIDKLLAIALAVAIAAILMAFLLGSLKSTPA